MTEKKGEAKARPSPADASADLKEQRDTFVHTFFKKGAEFTEELVRENDRLRKHLGDVENALPGIGMTPGTSCVAPVWLGGWHSKQLRW